MESKRLAVLKYLTSHLETINQHDLSGKVWRGRQRPADESQAPFILLFEMPPEGQDQADSQVANMPWFIGIQGYVEADHIHPTDPAHNLMAAVKQKLGELMDEGGSSMPGEKYMMGGLVENVEVDGGMCFEADETTNCSFFALKLTLGLVENTGNPYAEE